METLLNHNLATITEYDGPVKLQILPHAKMVFAERFLCLGGFQK